MCLVNPMDKYCSFLMFCLYLIQYYCVMLQVFDKCYEGGAVSPTTCVYMKEWLELT